MVQNSFEEVSNLRGSLISSNSIFRHITAPRVLLFNKNYSKVSPGDPIPLLRIIHEALYADTPVMLQGVVFCTDYLDEIGKEKSGMIPLHVCLHGLTCKIRSTFGWIGRLYLPSMTREPTLRHGKNLVDREILS